MPTIHVIGNVQVDLILGPHDQWPQLGTEVLVDQMQLRVGGSAGNSLLALRGIGASVHAIANTGPDAFGEWLRHELHDIPSSWLIAQAPTSVTVALNHVSGERTFFTHLGHLNELTWIAIQSAVETIKAGDIVLLAGAFLTPNLRADYPVMLTALKQQGARIAIDPGWPTEGWTSSVRQEVSGWLTYCDDVLFNEQELCAFSGVPDVFAAARETTAMLPGNANLIAKRGADGASAWRGQQVVHVNAPRVTVVDTVGAGDTFNAAYLWACLTGHSTEQALMQGALVASHAISTSPRNYLRPHATATTVQVDNPQAALGAHPCPEVRSSDKHDAAVDYRVAALGTAAPKN